LNVVTCKHQTAQTVRSYTAVELMTGLRLTAIQEL